MTDLPETPATASTTDMDGQSARPVPVVKDGPVKDPGLDPDHSKRRRFRDAVLKITLGLAVLSPLLFMLAGLGSRIGLWSWQFGLGTLTREVGPVLLIATLVMGLFAGLLAFLIKPRKGLLIALVAVLVPVIAFASISSVRATAASLPFIHDITTDTQDPPVFGDTIRAERANTPGVNTLDYAGKRAPAGRDAAGEPVTELVSALQTQAYPEIRTLVLSEAPEAVFERAERTARDMGWAIKDSDPALGRIDATDTTFWYGFKDDIAIRLRPAQGGGTRVDLRSVSRVGGSDLGANAARVGAFLDAMSG